MTVTEINKLFASIGIIPINIDVSGTNPIISFEIYPYKEFISERNHKLEKAFESVFTGSMTIDKYRMNHIFKSDKSHNTYKFVIKDRTLYPAKSGKLPSISKYNLSLKKLLIKVF